MIYTESALKELEKYDVISIALSLQSQKSVYVETFVATLDKLSVNVNKLSLLDRVESRE